MTDGSGNKEGAKGPEDAVKADPYDLEAWGLLLASAKDDDKKTAQRTKKRTKGSVATGRGRKNRSGKMWDDNRNEIDPATGKAKSKWDNWDETH